MTPWCDICDSLNSWMGWAVYPLTIETVLDSLIHFSVTTVNASVVKLGLSAGRLYATIGAVTIPKSPRGLALSDACQILASQNNVLTGRSGEGMKP